MENKNKELEFALVDVRRAYRLLYAFHKRAKDTVDLIAEQFADYAYYKSSPTYNNAPNFQTNPHSSRWLWDLFPAYNYSMLFLPEFKKKNDTPQNDDCMLEVRLVCDDEYQTAYNENDDHEPNPLKFNSAETTKTSIIIEFWKCDKTPSQPARWVNIWYNYDYPDNYGEVKSFEVDDGKFTCFDVCFSIADLPDKESIIKCVCETKEIATKKLDLQFSSDELTSTQ